MHLRNCLILSTVLLALWQSPSTAAPEAAADEAVAIVSWVRGEATLRQPATAAAVPVKLLDRLAAGSLIETASAAEVTVVLIDGQRYAIGAASQVSVEAASLEVLMGSVRSLQSIPAIARLSRIAPAESPGRHAAAIRIRTAATAGSHRFELYPRAEAAVFGDDATLRFSSRKNVGEVRIEVKDAAGLEVFSTSTAATEIRIPAGALEPGAAYYWRVESALQDILHGGAIFRTLSEDAAGARRELAAQAEASGEPGLALLLAAVDHRLGLRREACEGLARIVAAEPDAVDGALEAFGCAL